MVFNGRDTDLEGERGVSAFLFTDHLHYTFETHAMQKRCVSDSQLECEDSTD